MHEYCRKSNTHPLFRGCSIRSLRPGRVNYQEHCALIGFKHMGAKLIIQHQSALDILS